MAGGKRIGFGSYTGTGSGGDWKWKAVPDYEFERRSLSPLFKPTERVEYAALARINSIGHAEFAAGELAEIMGRTLEDGARKLASDSTVYLAIEKAVARGTLAPGSRPKCLVVPRSVAQTTEGTTRCLVHKIGLKNAA